MSDVTLILTVGGSPQPVASALQDARPGKAIFLVSGASDGTQSSRPMVEDHEIEYDRSSGRKGPGLRHVDGCPQDVKVIEVPADDPDTVFREAQKCILELQRRGGGHDIVADYTGGTKSMSSGLLWAAISAGIGVQFMQGRRSSLDKVSDGSEKPFRIGTQFIAAEREMERARQFVSGYDYAAAAQTLNDLRKRLEQEGARFHKTWRRELDAAHEWCRFYAEWDRFNHGEALRRYSNLPGDAQANVTALGHDRVIETLGVAGKHGAPWHVCADLFRNAGRCAARGRYDDAVARAYRLVEAAVQAQLYTRFGKETGAVDPADLPDEMRNNVKPRFSEQHGRKIVQLALEQSVNWLLHLDPDDPVAAVCHDERTKPRWLGRRNKSILAHGFTPVGSDVWEVARDWLETHLAPHWQEAAFAPFPRDLPGLAADRDTARG